MSEPKEMLPAQLAEMNGEGGKPTYVAYDGKVYDVSGSKLWPKGFHMMRHHAGTDLTVSLQTAPHGPEMLERYPQIGILKKEEPLEDLPPALSRLLTRFPFLRRHPHPMTVHFPIVFAFSSVAFTFLFLLTGIGTFETTALNCLGTGILFIPVAMATGYYTWWLNYTARPMRPVYLKKRLSAALFAVNTTAFVWRVADPGIVAAMSGWTVIYLLLVFALLPLVTVIGWLGAGLTFPVEKE